MYRRLGHSAAEISVTKRDEYYELVLVTTDRPFLFAKIAGTISSWGMNILKADACANKQRSRAGYAALFRPLPHARSQSVGNDLRLKQQLLAAISGELDVAAI